MEKQEASLFQVYLRLRPPPRSAASSNPDKCLLVEDPEDDGTAPTHITLNPPNDRPRRVERFGFTQVFDQDATQLDLFQGTRVLPLVEGVLAPHGGDGTDGLLATLGVTGSGKTHTMLGSKSQRGLTQLALDVLFRSMDTSLLTNNTCPSLESSIRTSDASEATIFSAPAFLETVYSDYGSGPQGGRAGSRAATPMTVRKPCDSLHVSAFNTSFPRLPGHFPESPKSVRLVNHEDDLSHVTILSTPPGQQPMHSRAEQTPAVSGKPKLAPDRADKKRYMAPTSAIKSKRVTKTAKQGDFPSATPRRLLQQTTNMPQQPDISSIRASCDPSAEYAIVISMYEVYNDRIFDLLAPPVKSNATKEFRRRPLLFKHTELSPDRKVVAGLRKVICGTLKEALMVLEAGLHERRVAGTGSNSTSSRSHGFFSVEIKKRRQGRSYAPWGTSTLSIVDLAGSERARDAKTQGTTLAEAGKINESLMYLGQCLQMQSDIGNNTKPNLVPFRQCKLTELLFSNSFPSTPMAQSTANRRAPQKGVMIVTADPVGDYNATSQILRYSALAREVTVPRIPSITQTILASAMPPPHELSPGRSSPGGRSSPLGSPLPYNRPFYQPSGTHSARNFSSETERATMENAALEIARMAEVIEQLNLDLSREADGRLQAEAHLLSMEDRVVELEQEIREECYADFEQRLALEMNRFKASLSLEQERGEEHWDRKVEVLARTVGVTVTSPSDEDSADYEHHQHEDDKENVLIENLEQENDRLRHELSILKRELGNRTPTKRAPLQERGDVPSSAAGRSSEMASLRGSMESLRVSGNEERRVTRSSTAGNGSPTKKVRNLRAKRWESLDNDDSFN